LAYSLAYLIEQPYGGAVGVAIGCPARASLSAVTT
jgi:hypothetical protein